MIVIAIGAVLCGPDRWVNIADGCDDKEAWLKTFFELPHGTPSHDAFGKVFRLLGAAVFERCFREGIARLIGAVQGVVAFDGKTVSGPKAAWHRTRKARRKKAMNWRGSVRVGCAGLKRGIVTMDALGCQTDVAEKIVAQGGD